MSGAYRQQSSCARAQLARPDTPHPPGARSQHSLLTATRSRRRPLHSRPSLCASAAAATVWAYDAAGKRWLLRQRCMFCHLPSPSFIKQPLRHSQGRWQAAHVAAQAAAHADAPAAALSNLSAAARHARGSTRFLASRHLNILHPLPGAWHGAPCMCQLRPVPSIPVPLVCMPLLLLYRWHGFEAR